MSYPGDDPTKLTIEQILERYKRSGLKPTQKQPMNAMIREQYLSLRETHAFYTDLVNRGAIKDDGGAAALQSAYEKLEGYIQHINGFNYT